MGNHNILIQKAREMIWLDHRTFHNTPATFPNELCIFCAEEVEAAQQDHLLDEQEKEELENV